MSADKIPPFNAPIEWTKVTYANWLNGEHPDVPLLWWMDDTIEMPKGFMYDNPDFYEFIWGAKE